MSEDRVIGQFDVTLSEDLVKDVQTSGRTVKTEIWEQGEGKRGLVGCIFVDKNEQDVVRLRVTVFNQPGEGSTSEEGNGTSTTSEHVLSQTEHSGAIPPCPGDVIDQCTQAAQEMDEKLMQTEQQIMGEQCSQTDKVVQDQKQSQTDTSASVGKTTQTKLQSFCETAMQTNRKEFNEQFMQTDIKVFCPGVAQTDIKQMASTGFQTDPKPQRDFNLQTDQWIGTHQCLQVCPDLVESAFQTDPKPIRVTAVQTEIDTDEKFMQTENPIAEKAIQTRVITCEQVQQTDPLPVQSTPMQTDNPPLLDTAMQTGRDYLIDLCSQTDDVIVIDPEELCENDSQTDFVRVIDPRNEVETACQSDPCKVIYPDHYVDAELQTDSIKIIDPEAMLELEAQTDDVHIRDPEKMVELEVQTDDVAFKGDTETVDTEAQTNLVWIFGLTQAPEPDMVEGEEPKQAAGQDKEGMPEVSNIPEGGEMPQGEAPPDLEAAPSKASMESNIIQGGPVDAADAVAPEGTDISADQETQKGIQTDPVTIIIGDSSFLVNKLKVYAQREMRFMEGGRRRGGPRTRGRGRGRGVYAGPPALTQAGDLPMGDGEDGKDMPILNAEGTPRGAAAARRTPMSAPAATRRPFTGLRHRTSPQDIKEICKTPEKKGRFNCPFCQSVFNDSATLYKHLREQHGSPRASNRRRRRKGTILIAEDGSLITDDGTIEIPPLKKDVPLGPIRANNTHKSQSAILHEQHMAKMRALANTESLKKSTGERSHAMAKVVSNGTNSETIQISETPLMGQRAFSCPFCPKLFTKSSSLYIHLQNAHKAVKQKVTRPRSKLLQEGEDDEDDEELVEYDDEDTELVHETEVELVVPADAAHAKLEEGELEQEEGEIPLEELHGKVEEEEQEEEEIELQAEQGEEGEVPLEQGIEEGEVQLETSEVVSEEVVQEEVIEEAPTEDANIAIEEQTTSEPVPAEPEEGEVPEAGGEILKGELEEEVEEDVEEEVQQEETSEEQRQGPRPVGRPRGKVRTRGGVSRRPAQGERGTKRRRSEPEDDDEEMPKLTRVTRRSVQLESPTRSTRRGPKILSPAKRGRR